MAIGVKTIVQVTEVAERANPSRTEAISSLQLVCPSIHSSVHLSDPSTLPSIQTHHPPTLSSPRSILVHPFTHSLNHLFIYPPTQPSINLSIRPSIHPHIHPPIHLPIYPSIHPPIYPSTHPSIHPSIILPIHPFNHSPIHLSNPYHTFNIYLFIAYEVLELRNREHSSF